MSTPEQLIALIQEPRAPSTMPPDIDAAGAPPALTEEQILSDKGNLDHTTGDYTCDAPGDLVTGRDPLQLKLAEERRARNADLDTSSSMRSQSRQSVENARGTPSTKPSDPHRLRLESEDMLFQHAENGDESAKEILVEGFMPLVRQLARRYAGSSEIVDDLTQVASIGLLKAMGRFDRSKGFAFTTFAVPTIIGELKRHFRDHERSIRVARSLQEASMDVRKTLDALQKHPHDVSYLTLKKVAEELDMPYEEVLEAWLVVEEASRPVSLDRPVVNNGDKESGTTLLDTMTDGHGEDVMIGRIALKAEVKKLLAHASLRDKEIFVRRHILGQTQREIADAVGVSQMHVSRITRRMLEGSHRSSDR